MEGGEHCAVAIAAIGGSVWIKLPSGNLELTPDQAVELGVILLRCAKEASGQTAQPELMEPTATITIN
jgi:hypothetical protein